jgi:hypothetical protein
MTADQPPAAAVQIAQESLNATRGFGNVQGGYAENAVAALAERYAFVDRAKLAAVIAAYRKVPLTVRATCGDELADALAALAALDAAPAGTTAEGDPPPPGAGLPILCP